jgi:hypothetical protein
LNPNGQYPLRPWRHPFTTFLQAEDNPADFQWRACQEGTPACQQAVQRSAPLLPLASVRVPANSLVKLAREGLKPSAPPSSAPDLRRLPAIRKPLVPKPVASPIRQPNPARRATGLSLIRAYAAVKLRLSLMQQWFSNLTAASRAKLGIFAALLLLVLGLIAMKMNWFNHPQTGPVKAVAPPSAQTTEPPLPRDGKPDNPAPDQTAPFQPASARAESPDPKQLDWLSGDGRTFVFATSDFARFDLPMDQIGPFESLIHRFDLLQMLPKDIQLSLSTNRWDAAPGAPMSVKANTHELTAQTASGLWCSFNYEDFLRNARPVVVTTSFATPPGALSVQFRFTSPNNGEPFRLLIVNESRPPAPRHLSLRWLRTNRTTSIAASLQEPLHERLLGRFTLLKGQQFQLRPFIKVGQQTNYLYENWPGADLPADGEDLNFAEVRKHLARRQEQADAVARLKLAHKEQELTFEADRLLSYPFGKDLGLPDSHPLISFRIWTNAPPLPALFLSYLGDLQKEVQKEGTANTNSDWVALWPSFRSDNSTNLPRDLQMLYFSWIRNVPSASNNPAFPNNYFATNWQVLKELESIRRQEVLLQANSAQERMKLVPDTLEAVAYVGLYIIDPMDPRHRMEIIRFEGP